jgi:hypothetical protein
MNEEEIPKKENNELKTLKYKTTILNGYSWPTTEQHNLNNMENLEKFLENEKNNNANEPWNKLDKTAKIKKLLVFSQKYKIDNELTEEDYNKLVDFLKDCLARKKLLRVKDVKYDIENGEVKDIPSLFHNKNNNNFTLKNLDKRVSSLKGLAPKKKVGTAKNIVQNNSDSESERD